MGSQNIYDLKKKLEEACTLESDRKKIAAVSNPQALMQAVCQIGVTLTTRLQIEAGTGNDAYKNTLMQLVNLNRAAADLFQDGDQQKLLDDQWTQMIQQNALLAEYAREEAQREAQKSAKGSTVASAIFRQFENAALGVLALQGLPQAPKPTPANRGGLGAKLDEFLKSSKLLTSIFKGLGLGNQSESLKKVERVIKGKGEDPDQKEEARRPIFGLTPPKPSQDTKF